MLKIIVVIIALMILYVLWRLYGKNKTRTAFQVQSHELAQMSHLERDDLDLPEKTKLIKQIHDEQRQKTLAETVVSDNIDALNQNLEISVESLVTDEDQKLFDEAAQFFFSQAIQNKDISQAENIQQNLLSKMPMQAHSQIGSFDLGEWSVFWHYHEQSLEYYVGRYGVFYTHVDRDGIEHKAEFKVGC